MTILQLILNKTLFINSNIYFKKEKSVKQINFPNEGKK